MLSSSELLKLIDTLNSDEAKFARKSVDFYDGKQLTHMVSMLNDTQSGRKNWQARGFRPFYRNLTKVIVDKSGLLYVNGMPKLEVWTDSNTMDDAQTEKFNNYVHESDLDEFLINLDSVVRLLKTAAVLVQYDSDTDYFSFDTLHKGNSVILFNYGLKVPHTLIHMVDKYDDCEYYRVWYPEEVQLWKHYPNSHGKAPEPVESEPNPYGFIPVVCFHDTNLPRNGVWNTTQRDLVTFNGEYNMFLIDAMWASAYSMRKTLYTNMKFTDEDFEDSYQGSEVAYGDKLPRTRTGHDETIHGPDGIVQVNSQGVDSPLIQFLGPEIDIKSVFEMFNKISEQVAQDWSVMIRAEGYGQINSGFQLIVEEIPNLELRKQRSRMQERALGRMFNVMNTMLLITNPDESFSDDAQFYIEFQDPSLPVDPMAEDEKWVYRIENKLATRKDYFMQVQGMSEEEALQKISEIDGEEEQVEPVENPQPFVPQE